MKHKTLSPNDESVLGALDRSGRPLSAYDILANAQPSSLKAPVQVYRSLQKLEQHGLVHRIEALNAFVACSEKSHIHHRPGFIICRDCGTVREFDDERMREIAEVAAGPDFTVELVTMEVFGHCGCANDAA